MELALTSQAVASKKATEDYELVKRAILGDEQAYAALMRRYQRSLYHLMLKMVNDTEDANDLTIEAFGKAFAKLPNYVPHHAFSTWLFKIAINNCIDFVRKKKLRVLSIHDPLEPDSMQDYSTSMRIGNPDPEEQCIRKQRIKLIRGLLDRLNDRYRLMIELRFFEEKSYEEIATELSLPLGTVKAQLFRAKEMLYEMLQQPNASAHFETLRRRG